MGEEKYKVVTKGIIDGEKVAEVRLRLLKCLKKNRQSVDRIIDSAHLVVKRDLDLNTAEAYRQTLHDAGIICEVQRQNTSLETMVCPKCGFRQAKADTCIRCGVLVDRYVEKDAQQKEVIQKRTQEHKDAVDGVAGLMSKLYKIWTLKGGRAGIVIIGLFLVYSLFETIWLRGDLITHKRVNITGPRNFVEFTAKEGSKEYTIEVYTKQKRKLHVRLVDSTGKVLYENTEYVSHKGSRSFTFKPPQEGPYRVYVGLGPLSLYAFTRATVSVYVNDRRVLPRVFGRLKL